MFCACVPWQAVAQEAPPPHARSVLCRFALPALLPLITPDLNLTDHEGALLTVGYTVCSHSPPWTIRLPCLAGSWCHVASLTSRLAPMQVLYAVALVPAGFLADRTDRPRLLAGGLAVWSLLTMAASKVRAPALTAMFMGWHDENMCCIVCGLTWSLCDINADLATCSWHALSQHSASERSC